VLEFGLPVHHASNADYIVCTAQSIATATTQSRNARYTGRMTTFPQNFDLLAAGEDQIRQLSKAAIEASEDLSLHATMIEQAMNMLDYMSKRRPHADEDELVLQMLAARLFNSGASATKLMMGGYYQSTVMLMRDILETTFLLDFFHSNRDQIAVWRACDEKKRNREFGAMRIRMALDDRDGYTERKREAAYNLLCQLGTHPTFTDSRCCKARGRTLSTSARSSRRPPWTRCCRSLPRP
jgi:hypothetical protein